MLPQAIDIVKKLSDCVFEDLFFQELIFMFADDDLDDNQVEELLSCVSEVLKHAKYQENEEQFPN